ncbi:alginate export family protein [Thalassotalea crassostreae]|uniref:alginate export family protein n=1 Tax=Thalassotalea crassostreae TaxID=1763536 RepID=UPI0009ECC7B3|nr:alginate export family protein [Thalassotalea crassostreae]
MKLKNIINNNNKSLFAVCALASSVPFISTTAVAAEATANTSKSFVDFRLRFESVEQDNALEDAEALTLRTLVHYQTKNFNGLSAVVEFEDSRDVNDVEDYNDATGNNTEYSVIADPNTTELDQGFIQYKGKGITAKVGRQVITFDGHRFVGHVGWRQDKQTFDGVSFNYSNDKLSASYAYINKRNRIFAESKDIESMDHLINASYKLGFGKLTGYGYLLEVDQDTDNALDTFGVSLDGKGKLFSNDVNYRFEYATQTSETGASEYDADYINVEGGIALGKFNFKIGLEALGSDDGQYGFSTPLATLHKFNGWSDQFLGTPTVGLNDIYVSASTKLLGGSVLVALHDFSANDDGYGIDDLGSELNVQYATKFATYFNGGIKFAAYSAGDDAAGKVDTDKVWLWVGARF